MGDVSEARRLSTLSVASIDRFRRGGDVRDLDQAVDAARRAAALTPLDHPDQAVHFMNLCAALQDRYQRTDAVEDLFESVSAAIQAVAATGVGHPSYPAAVTNFAMVMRARFERIGNLSDLDAVIAMQRDLVDSLPPGHADEARHLAELGVSLRVRFERTGARDDLIGAVDACRRAVDATPPDDPALAARLTVLGNAWRTAFEHTARPSDLDAAVNAHRRAVKATPSDHPDRTGRLTNLGHVLRMRSELRHSPADLDEVLRCYTEASEVVAGQTFQRMTAARSAAVLAERKGDLAGAANLLEAAVRLIPELTPHRLPRRDRQHQLTGISALVDAAADAALAVPSPFAAQRALELVESGRAVLLSQSLEIRGDLTDLRRVRPDLAARFAEIRDRLDRHTGRTLHTDPVAGRMKSTTDLFIALSEAARGKPERPDERIAIAEDLAATLQEIRALDGFARFGLPPTGPELHAQAAHGPIVTFILTENRCHALILTPDGVTALPLPGVTEQAVIDRTTDFHQALHGVARREIAPSPHGPDTRHTLTAILEWLWDNVTGPVLDHLGHRDTPTGEWPRVWWAPGGRLGLLPLHAAGHHTDRSHRTVLDRVISSYTPTIRALGHARARTAQNPTSSLIVAMPTTPGLPGDGPLPHVLREAEALRTLLPDPVTLVEPAPGTTAPDTPTARRVLDELPQHAIAHFACHGTHDTTDPAASTLLLHDHAESPLTVAHLAPIDLHRAQLAYLSACNTALNKADRFLNEAIHLAAAFHLAGFPHVVGTLWSVDDEIAVEFATRFYRALGTPTGLDVERSAHALHTAVRAHRDAHTATPYLWASHLHWGA
ncbi:CHAT domain-containing protein [Actinosynnema sp. CA-248983]